MGLRFCFPSGPGRNHKKAEVDVARALQFLGDKGKGRDEVHSQETWYKVLTVRLVDDLFISSCKMINSSYQLYGKAALFL